MRNDRKAKRETLSHGFGPFYDPGSRILILGSFPSVKSREQNFYYGHPRNRFWRVLSTLFDARVPETVDEKKAFLTSCHIALYDVIEQCSICGSSDSSIRDVVPADLSPILSGSQVGSRIYTNGARAYELYRKHLYPRNGIEAVKLPSTSPANAAYSLDDLVRIWSEKIER
ncbi:MAG: DNA-deoxyinosine glycosylase [Anaerovoracaceae bacterium]|jgi:TDG/mug DNA glycosylase family protein